MRPSRCRIHAFPVAAANMASAFAALAGRAPDPGNGADRTLVAEAWEIVMTDLLVERRSG
jgi:hypothetical protein